MNLAKKNLGNLDSKYFFFLICGVMGCNLKYFKHMKRYFELQIQKALDIIFLKHSYGHWLKINFIKNSIKKIVNLAVGEPH